MAINFGITADGNQAKREMQQVQQSIRNMSQEADAAGISMKEMFKQALAFGGITAGVAGLQQFASKVVDVRKEMQRFQISFDTLLGDRQKASAMFGEMKQMAAATPLMLKDLAGAAQTMLGFNIAAEQIIPTLKAIGDISMGDAQRFQGLALAFSQVSAAGKLTGQDLMQMINAGFNPLSEISRKTGKSMSELKEEMSNGAVSSKMVADAFMSATGEGGKFFGMLEKQGKGLAGQINTLNGAISDMFAEIGEHTEGLIAGSIGALTSIVQAYDKVGRAIATVVAAYGTYKAALIAVNAVEMASHVGWGMTVKSLLETARATKAATAAMKLYNLVLKANPYALAASAVVALAGAIWTFASNAGKGVDAQKALNREIDAFAAKQKEQKEAAEGLLQVIQDETATDAQRITAYQQLKIHCAALTNEYSLEELQVLKLADAYKLLNQAQEKQSMESKVETINKQVRAYNELQRMIATRGSRNQSRLSEDTTAYLNSLGFVGMEPEQIAAELKKSFTRLKGEVQPYLDRQKNETKTTYQEDARKAMNDWKAAKAAYQRILKEQGSTSEEVKKAQAAMEAKDKAYEELTGRKASAVEQEGAKVAAQRRSNSEQLGELEERLDFERARAAMDRELERQQAVINAMADGGEKQRRQLELDYKKEQETIERAREDLIKKREDEARELWEAQNPDSKQTWASSGEQAKYRATAHLSKQDEELFSERMKAATAAYNRGTAELVQAEQQHMREYLREYGSYQEQRLAITQDYDDRIEKAEDEWQRKMLRRRKEADLKQLDADSRMREIQANPDYIDAMIDPARLGMDALGDLNEMLEDAKEELATLPPDQLRAISDLMQQLNDEIVERNPFAAISTGMRELADARASVKDAKEEMEAANREYQTAVDSGDEDVAEKRQRAEDAMNRYINALNDEQRAETKVEKGKRRAAEAVSQLAGAIDGVAASTQQFGGKTSEMISAIGSLVNFVGVAMQTTSMSASSAIKAIESASVVLAVISAAIQLATAAADLFGLSKDDSRYEDAKREYNALRDVWDDLIRKKQEYMDISWGVEAREAGKAMQDLVQKQTEAARQLARERLGAGSSWGSHSYGYRMNRDLGGYFSQIGITDIEQLTRMTGEELSRIKEDYAVFWAKMDDDFRDYLEDIIAGVETLEDIEDDIREKFTSMTFDDMYDSFVDKLMDMKSSSEDFADDVSSYFFKAILNNQVGTKYREKLEQWYNDMAAMLEAHGGELTAQEMDDLQHRYQGIVQEAIDMRDKIAEATGFSSTSALATTVSSSFSQESVDEVNGRLAAMQLGQQQIVTQGIQLADAAGVANMHLSDLVGMAAIRNSTLADVYDRIGVMSRTIADALAQIADNTKGL